MAAATDNRKWQGDGAALTRDQIANALNGPIAAGQTLYAGTIIGQLYSDTAVHPALYNFVGDGTMRAVGICTVGADANTPPSQPANSRPPRVIAAVGMFVDKNSGGGNAFSTANLFGPAYGVDNQTVSALPTDGPLIGQFVGLDFQTGQPMVLVDPVTALAFQLASGPGVQTARRARLVATGNLNLATTGLTAIDGVTPVQGDVILCVGQTTASQNGLYIATAGAWQRVPGISFTADATIEISEGTSWAHSTWKLFTQGAITLGTTALSFYPRVAKGSQALTAGAATVSNLYVASGAQFSATDTTAAAAVKGVLTAGAGSGSLALTGTTTDVISYVITNW